MGGALGVVITTDVPVEGRAAVPVYVDDSLPIVGPSRAIQVVTSGPMAGGPPMAVRLAPAGTAANGPALLVYVVAQGGTLGDALAYTLRLLFATAQAAPLTSPYTEGTGQVTLTDTGNKLSKSGGKLVASGAQSANSDPKVVGTVNSRVPGLALFASGASGTSYRIGYANSADVNLRDGVRLAASVFHAFDNGNAIAPLQAASGAYDLLIVQADYGGWSAYKNSGTAYTLLFDGGLRASGSTATNASETQKIHADIAAAWEVGDLIQWSLGGVFGRSFLWGQGAIEPDPAGVTLSSAADLFATVEWSPAEDATVELSIRRTNDDNRWIVRGDEAGNTIKLIERNAGSETERATASYTWGTTDKTRIWIRAEGQRIAFGTDTAQQGVYTSASFNQAATGVKVSASNTISLAYLRAIPLAVPALPPEGTRAGALPLNLFPVGHSTTNATTTDAARPFGVSAGYPRLLCDSVEQATERGCYERPARIGIGGGTAESINAVMDVQLSTRNHTPDYILVALGANDVGVSQSTFETNYAGILDKLHTKWPNAAIYCSLPWVRNQTSAINTIIGYIGNVLSTRAAWAFVGPDERIVIENGDNGTTRTDDGAHPNRAGHIAWAAAWKSSIGL